jgi:uncharacterized caspase-like protein
MSYETWAKQKREEYSQWQKMRAEIVRHLPSNPEADRIGSFIDQGFGETPMKPTAPTQPMQPVQNVQPTPMPAQNQQPEIPLTPPVATSPTMKVWVVIVGVADYLVQKNRLNYTDDDAYKMYAFYKSPEGGSLPDKQITLLIDEEATRANIVNAIKKVYSAAGKDDMLVFYFSGHGTEGAFITYEFDGTLRDDYSGLLLHKELNEVFERSPARYKYIVADACHSGSSVNQYKTRDIKTKGTFYQAFEREKNGFVLLLSSMGDEVSLETSGNRQGIFSYYLLRGLKGECDSNRDKTVSVIELYDYVEKNVRTYTNGSQNPVIAGKYDETLPMAVVRE